MCRGEDFIPLKKIIECFASERVAMAKIKTLLQRYSKFMCYRFTWTITHLLSTRYEDFEKDKATFNMYCLSINCIT